MTPQSVIDDVRELINDTDSTSYRYSTTLLLKFVNEALKRIALLRPDLFATFADIVCTVSTTVQSAPADSLRLMEVFRVVNGNALYESDRPTMDQNSPTWPADTAGPAITWMRHARHSNKFFIYPAAPATAQSLTIEYAQVPPDYTIAQTIGLYDSYKTAVVDCVIFLAQSIDDEHVNSGRAKLFFDSFSQVLGANAQTRPLTDTEAAGMPPHSGA